MVESLNMFEFIPSSEYPDGHAAGIGSIGARECTATTLIGTMVPHPVSNPPSFSK